MTTQTKTYEVTFVQNGYPISSTGGNIEEVRKWTQEVLKDKDGYVEIDDPETGGVIETHIKAKIFDENKNLIRIVSGEEDQTIHNVLNEIRCKEGWSAKYETYGDHGNREIIQTSYKGIIVPVSSPTDIADWATRKYGEDALYMMAYTDEGRAVWGDEPTNGAIEVLKDRGYTEPEAIHQVLTDVNPVSQTAKNYLVTNENNDILAEFDEEDDAIEFVMEYPTEEQLFIMNPEEVNWVAMG